MALPFKISIPYKNSVTDYKLFLFLKGVVGALYWILVHVGVSSDKQVP